MKEMVFVYGYHTGQPEGEALFTYLDKEKIAYRALTQTDCKRKIAVLVDETAAKLPSYSLAPSPDDKTYHLKEGQEAVLLFCHFTKERLNEVLLALKKSGAAPLPLKAVLTENNREWYFSDLGVELGIEHRFMQAYLQLRQAMAVTDELDKASYTKSSWERLEGAKAEAELLLAKVGKEEILPEVVENCSSALLNAYFSLVTKGETSDLL